MSCKHDSKLSCPCLKGLLGIGTVLLIMGIVWFISINYDHNVRWIEWIQLFVDIVGAITIPIVVWWLSNYRIRKIEEKSRRKNVINQVLADFLIFSRQLKNYLDVIKQANQGCVNIIKILNVQPDDNSLYKHMQKVFCVFSAIKSLNYNSNDISFISIKRKDLYINLLILKAKEIDLDDDIAFRNRNVENMNMVYNKDNDYIGKVIPIQKFKNIVKILDMQNQLSFTVLERNILFFQSVFKDLQNFIEKDMFISIEDILNDKYLKEILVYKFEKINPNEEYWY